MRNFINTQGHAVVQPRFVAQIVQHHILGRVLSIRDNFPHLDGADSFGAKTVYRELLGADDKVLPILAEHGFRLAGAWKVRRNTAFASIERV